MILEFCKLVHTPKDSAAQNAMITRYMVTYSPVRVRTRTQNSGRVRRVNVQYQVRATDSVRKLVCAKTFQSITGFST